MADPPLGHGLIRRLAAPALAALTVAGVFHLTGLTTPFDRAFLDFATRLVSRNVSSDLVVVEIDARSLHELGSWPWSRKRHADLLDRLHELGARQVFVDIDFSSPSTPSDDEALSQALTRWEGTVILPQFWQPLSVDSRPLLLSEPLPALRAHASMGSVNLVPDSDGLVREIPDLNVSDAGSAPPVWRRLVGIGPRQDLTLDFRIAPYSYTKYSYCDLLQGLIIPDLRGKTILLGATAVELGDSVPVPVYRSLPGVLVQAIAYESGKRPPLRSASAAGLLAALASTALLSVYLMGRTSWRTLPWLTGALLIGALLSSYLPYVYLNVIPAPAPLIATVLCSFAGVVLSMLYTETWRSWRTSRQLKQHDALLRQIVDRSADALFTLDAGGTVKTVNEATARLLRRDIDSLRRIALRELAPELAELLALITPDREIRQAFIELALPDGGVAPVEVSARHLAWEDGSVVSVTLHDVSTQRRREEELRHRATHDSLTGLPNRLKLIELLTAALVDASIESPVHLLVLDLDGFAEVNDTLGHEMGDALLVEVGKRFAELMPRCACIARLSGDKFAVLAAPDQPAAGLPRLCAAIKTTVSTPIVIQDVPISLGISIGIATGPTDGERPNQLLQCADLALFSAKRNYTEVEAFNPNMNARTPRRLQMLTLLRAAIRQEELQLLFQPKVRMHGESRPEVEVLCRWTSAVLGPVSPTEFIALAEASDVIRPLSEWTLRRALGYCASFHAQGLALKVAVNLSARHLQDEQLPNWLGRLLKDCGVGVDCLELEITEGAIMRDPERALRILQNLRELGVTLTIDDYGTGYSSLSYLQRLSVHRVKIDKSFVSGLPTQQRDQLIVKSTIDLAHALDLDVIAEGIETAQQFQMLRALGCDYAQGYLLARPLPADQVFAWFESRSAASQRPLAASA